MRLPEEPAILEVRHAVRAWLAAHAPTGPVTVALSGGADSLALTAAAVAEADVVHAVVVDHRLQSGSAEVADRARQRALTLGCLSAEVVSVEVQGPGGVEAAARRARYAALGAAAHGRPVLLGHTLDDQAETVLLGLARGSGGRSIWGMSPFDEPWGRPLLGVRRAVTRTACRELGLDPYEDPHNSSPDFVRVRLRAEVLPLLEDVLGGGVSAALARTADQLREDGAVLDVLAADVGGDARGSGDEGVDVAALEPAAPPVRRRVLRSWLLDAGATSLTDKQLRAVDDLVGRWRGQGGVAVGGGSPEARLVVTRRHGRLSVGLDDRGRV
ncbi:tRNA lysidine(34) synthetase TilS [Rhodococcus triatomae]|uniref:tRNA(Ile)-lysidine synthase n=1 Tax=Rhodococcus triatomae TaxID=300028 RepID=A0A1G8RZD1_9NOCA|nr:tRNA lysidine(34) synthetase TilS [Rhodococcus triatomae]QNG17359.1 tRNA lysidine(34) synthetase TilS [Rhodococcus triatomae]QNG22974.1 tRNA lysidine(34) synthetase TilS [Rhodococcus triatomae]SDJ22328.1 tRNA(Ile)-lysidine synthase [Rhodococcus triatomae]